MLLGVMLIDLPVELGMVGVSGEAYNHYFMALLPVFSLFAGLAFWASLKLVLQIKKPNVRILFTLFMTAVFCAPSVYGYTSYAQYYRHAPIEAVVPEIITSTNPQDYVLLWGGETAANFYAHRQSPTRFVYQYPLYRNGYADEKITAEFINDVERHRPRLIVDTKNSDAPFLELPYASTQQKAALKTLISRYTSRTVGDWTVYELDGNDTDH